MVTKIRQKTSIINSVQYLDRFPAFLQLCFISLFTDGILFLSPDGTGFIVGCTSRSNSRNVSELSVFSLALEDPESTLSLLGTWVIGRSVLLEFNKNHISKCGLKEPIIGPYDEYTPSYTISLRFTSIIDNYCDTH
jgi:hypothetical protein